jgi:uroporphyrinogen-III synthase
MAGLLMTRPRDAAERFVDDLPRHVIKRFPPVFSPLIRIQAGSGPIPDADAGGLIFSSKNGVRAAASNTPIRNKPVYCVGASTTIAAQKAGWQAFCMGQNADQLVENLTSLGPETPLLHVRGRHARGDISARLNAAGVACSEYVAYEQVLLPLSRQARQLLADSSPVLVPVFSPRTARQFAEHCPDGANLFLIALSTAVAEPLNSLNYKRLLVCESPDSGSMRKSVIEMGEMAL